MKFLLAVWKLVKVIMIALMHGFGALLIVLALFSLMRIGVFCVFGELTFFGGSVGFGNPKMVIGPLQFSCATWGGISILVLIDLFLLAWGWDFVKAGRSKRTVTPSGRSYRALAALRLKLLF